MLLGHKLVFFHGHFVDTAIESFVVNGCQDATTVVLMRRALSVMRMVAMAMASRVSSLSLSMPMSRSIGYSIATWIDRVIIFDRVHIGYIRLLVTREAAGLDRRRVALGVVVCGVAYARHGMGRLLESEQGTNRCLAWLECVGERVDESV